MPKKKLPNTRPLYALPPPLPAANYVGGVQFTPIPAPAYLLREDGSISLSDDAPPDSPDSVLPATPPRLVHTDPARSLWLYHGNCLEVLDAIAAKYPEGRFDCIFADPPYFLSNGGISCHAGKPVAQTVELGRGKYHFVSE